MATYGGILTELHKKALAKSNTAFPEPLGS
jgi:hypothetical protein